MITDLRAAELCLASYGAKAAADTTFDIFDEGDDDGVCWAIVRESECDVIVLRGSVTPHDWVVDTMAAPYIGHRPLGPVHHGFYNGLDNAWSDMSKLLRPHLPVVVTGHSLGAARAALLTGIMIDDGYDPAARIVFGEPKPGFAQLADFIKHVPARSYRNGTGEAHDIVTDLPFTIPALRLNYVHPVALTFVSGPPPVDDVTGMFAWHHMPLYLAALSNLKSA